MMGAKGKLKSQSESGNTENTQNNEIENQDPQLNSQTSLEQDQENTELSIENENHVCKHIKNYVRFSTIKNVVPHLNFQKCSECTEGKGLWICLTCGKQGCSRDANQHGLEHFKSTQHPIAYQVENRKCWCYTCDEFLEIEDYETLENCDDFILKQVRKKNPGSVSHEGTKRNKKLNQDLDIEEGLLKKNNTSTKSHKDVNLMNSKFSTHIRPKSVCGLSNLGNTCYFNSVLQALCRTTLLQKTFHDPIPSIQQTILKLDPSLTMQDLKDKKIVEHFAGPLTIALSNLLKSMWMSSTTLNPAQVLGEVRKKSSTFKGSRQQDSQELLRCVLDGMKSEETKIIQFILKQIYSEENPEEKKKLISLSQKATTFVDDIFGGKLIRRVVCHTCKKNSDTIEDFFDLCLPISKDYSLSKDSAWSKGKPTTASKQQIESLIRTPKTGLSKKDRRKMSKLENSSNESTPDNEEEKKEPEVKSEEKSEIEKENGEKQDMEKEKENGENILTDQSTPNENSEIEENQTKEKEKQIEEPIIENINSEEDTSSQPMETNNFEVGFSYTPKQNECSVSSCLASFFSKEVLTGDNKFLCENCSPGGKGVYSDATTQYGILQEPKILTLQLKRFEQRGTSMMKISHSVEYQKTLQLGKSDYELYAVVVHSGSLNSGHYTAYIKVLNQSENGSPAEELWFHISDSHVGLSNERNAISCSDAYLLFYEKVTNTQQ